MLDKLAKRYYLPYPNVLYITAIKNSAHLNQAYEIGDRRGFTRKGDDCSIVLFKMSRKVKFNLLPSECNVQGWQ